MNRKKEGIAKWRPMALEMEADYFGYKTAKKDNKNLNSSIAEKKTAATEKKPETPLYQDPAK